ncbi:hypothetical protein, partial [Corallococcus sp. AB049A]|uniref:hypothetical protein n=1 Tax=Corallococcus sp. AB049A TaxID=2316721 RepID=UPI001F3906F9
MKLDLLEWDPFSMEVTKPQSLPPYFTQMKWFEELCSYGSDDPKDDDRFLIPNLVKNVVLPRIASLIEGNHNRYYEKKCFNCN